MDIESIMSFMKIQIELDDTLISQIKLLASIVEDHEKDMIKMAEEINRLKAQLNKEN